MITENMTKYYGADANDKVLPWIFYRVMEAEQFVGASEITFDKYGFGINLDTVVLKENTFFIKVLTMIKQTVIHNKERTLNNYAEASYIMAKNDLNKYVLKNHFKTKQQ